MFVLMFTTLHWEGKLSNLMYHNNSHFFFCSWDKWPFRFVALKFKCTNSQLVLFCTLLKGGGLGGKGEESATWKKRGKLSFWGVGMGEEGKQSLLWLIKHIFQTLTKGECLKHKLWNSLQWPNYVINSVGNTKLPCYTLPPMQYHSFIRTLPP